MVTFRVISITMILLVGGCASLREDYTTRYGLTNPEYTPSAGVVDESYSGGTVGQQYVEDYDKKYHQKEVLPQERPVATEEQPQTPEQ